MAEETFSLESKDLSLVEAEFVNIKNSTIRGVEGGRVELQQVAALSIDGEKVDVTQGAAGMLRGGEIGINQSMAGIVVGGTNQLNFSIAPVVVSKEQNSAVRTAAGIVVSKEARLENSATVFLIANKVEGNVTTLLNAKTAVYLGAVIGGILGFVSLLKRK